MILQVLPWDLRLPLCRLMKPFFFQPFWGWCFNPPPRGRYNKPWKWRQYLKPWTDTFSKAQSWSGWFCDIRVDGADVWTINSTNPFLRTSDIFHEDTLRDQLTKRIPGKWIRIEDVGILLKMGIFQPAMLLYQRVRSWECMSQLVNAKAQ